MDKDRSSLDPGSPARGFSPHAAYSVCPPNGGINRFPVLPTTLDMGTETLVVDCPHCGATFESALGVVRLSFDFMRVEQMLEVCPDCCRSSRFDKADYRYEHR